ncbi:V-type ATPase assembly factor PKR1 [Aspergillus stella-maris]|uniref:V-type ATPase assembly factor PKR1 n=1 Tax=Aspergillus stella-maris TaxID=1810926 RepID=UPI003CCCD7E4
MASFVEDLWASIFTAGPTPTLLLATNVSFAALQAVLFMLLVGTRSYHFVFLSVISGALWYMINWFAQEVKQAQTQAAAQETQAEKTSEATQKETKARGAAEAADSDTETEGLAGRKYVPVTSAEPRSVTASTTLQVPGSESEVRKRLSVSGDNSGYTSTDSEWEKVEDNTDKE